MKTQTDAVSRVSQQNIFTNFFCKNTELLDFDKICEAEFSTLFDKPLECGHASEFFRQFIHQNRTRYRQIQ